DSADTPGEGAAGHGLLSVGRRPPVDGREEQIELHLLRPPERDLRAYPVEVHLMQRLRDDERFPDAEQLHAALERDIRRAQRIASSTTEVPSRIGG
ncbi:MAG: hypothetical protein JSW65_04295, partial [Candidatus Bipolaricaulota bacterium]